MRQGLVRVSIVGFMFLAGIIAQLAPPGWAQPSSLDVSGKATLRLLEFHDYTLPTLPEFRIRMPVAKQPLGEAQGEECEEPVTTTGHRIILAQQGCCSSHMGVCGCSSGGRTQCCEGKLSSTCTCTSPPPPTPAINSRPSGSPKPGNAGSTVRPNVTAAGSVRVPIHLYT